MDKMQSFYRTLTKKLDLPAEPLPGISVAEVWGDGRILIENHKGVIGYSREEVLVKTSCGRMEIRGEGLALSMMSREQLVISGKITAILLIRG